MKASNLIFLIIIIFLTPDSVYSQQARTLGIVAEAAVDDKMLEIEQLIGDWQIRVEMYNEEGAISDTYDGEWNFFYILGGSAIQDEFFLPPRSVEMQNETNRFIGTGLRTFNLQSNVWEATWVDSNGRSAEHWTGLSTEGKIVFTREDAGIVHRSSYAVEKGQFRWTQEKSSNGGKSWMTTQKAFGHTGK